MKKWLIIGGLISSLCIAEKDFDTKTASLSGNQLRMLFSDQETIISILRLHNARLEEILHPTNTTSKPCVLLKTALSKAIINNSYNILHINNQLIKDETTIMLDLSSELINLIQDILNYTEDK